MATVFTGLGNLVLVATALVGMGVGRNPSGFVHDIIEGYRGLRAARPVLYGGAAIGVLLYGLALAGVIGVWTFAIAALCVIMLLPVLGKALLDEGRRRETPPVLLGVDEPYTRELRSRLDRELGLPAAQKGAANVPA
jgi:hypothetical protein